MVMRTLFFYALLIYTITFNAQELTIKDLNRIRIEDAQNVRDFLAKKGWFSVESMKSKPVDIYAFKLEDSKTPVSFIAIGRERNNIDNAVNYSTTKVLFYLDLIENLDSHKPKLLNTFTRKGTKIAFFKFKDSVFCVKSGIDKKEKYAIEIYSEVDYNNLISKMN